MSAFTGSSFPPDAPRNQPKIFFPNLFFPARVVPADGSCDGAALDHDEHQFVASGVLLARRGLLPYRDYPYFHTPYLVLAYGVLFRCTAYLLLSARALSAAFGAATITTLLVCARQVARSVGASVAQSEAVGLTAALLLLTNPSFLVADGLAWNHDAAVCLTLLPAAILLRQIEVGYRLWLLFVAGFLLGLGIGVRLTVAPVAVAFLGFILADSDGSPPHRRWRRGGAFLAGLAVAMAPMAWLYSAAPRQFIFGNFGYSALNTAWREIGPERRDTSAIGKLLVFATVCFLKPGNLLLIAAAGASLNDAWRSGKWRTHPYRRQLKFLGLLMLFILVGSFAASPSFGVYFYAPVPFLILWLVYLLAPRVAGTEVGSDKLCRAVAFILLVAIIPGCPAYFSTFRPAGRAQWITLRAHHLGDQLRIVTRGRSPVLTLAPIFPLEGGLDIYETYATGPFSLRVAGMLPARQRRYLGLVDEQRLNDLARKRPPQAVLGGLEGASDRPLFLRGDASGCTLVCVPRNWDQPESCNISLHLVALPRALVAFGRVDGQ